MKKVDNAGVRCQVSGVGQGSPAIGSHQLLSIAIAALLVAPLHAQQDGAPELTAEASKAIDKGLKFLLTVQKKDGSWDSDGKGGHAVAITSLSLMAFMSKAHFPGFGPYAEPLDRGMKWMLKEAKQRPDGYLGSVMYEHGLATL
ncbi:MAG: hypothetical protein QF541_17370, partial [Lentisphaeria bacterium]|nr:hypothetical protein [Lentisphaeria bacterium]